MSIVLWLLIGAVIAAIVAPSNRYAFPSGRPACLLGGMAGAFLGGGILTVATESSETCVYAPSTAASACGALLIVAAVAWAGRGEESPGEACASRGATARRQIDRVA